MRGSLAPGVQRRYKADPEGRQQELQTISGTQQGSAEQRLWHLAFAGLGKIL
jgi:hypothetical protein